MTVDVEVWLPLLTLVLGYVGSLITESQRDKRTRQREQQAREESSRIEAEQQQRAFQRQTLMELQEALQGVARGAGKRHHLDTLALRATGTWRGGRLRDNETAAEFADGTRVLLLKSRVDDDETRWLVTEFTRMTSEHAIRPYTSEAEADSKLLEAVEVLGRIHERIGHLIRTVY